MGFVETIDSGTVVLTEGSIVERIRRESKLLLDPYVANASLVRNPFGRDVLGKIYRGYLDVARDFNRAIVMLAPTWRANPERVAKAGLGDAKQLNHDCVEYVCSIRDDYDDIREAIFIGGLLACKNDAYRAEEALSENESAEFHHKQAEALASAGVDIIVASTLPARSEAIGIARAIAGTGIPYVLSFVVRANGTLLDGNALGDVIDSIDSNGAPPAFYMLNCVHPCVCERALLSSASGRHRIKGLQANTSLKSPEDLEGLGELDSEDPDSFADAMVRVHRRLNINVLGGCCGTDERHIRAIAARLGRDDA